MKQPIRTNITLDIARDGDGFHVSSIDEYVYGYCPTLEDLVQHLEWVVRHTWKSE